jgi:hypothetical protein
MAFGFVGRVHEPQPPNEQVEDAIGILLQCAPLDDVPSASIHFVVKASHRLRRAERQFENRGAVKAAKPVVLTVGHVGHDHQLALYVAALDCEALRRKFGVVLKGVKAGEIYDLMEAMTLRRSHVRWSIGLDFHKKS